MKKLLALAALLGLGLSTIGCAEAPPAAPPATPPAATSDAPAGTPAPAAADAPAPEEKK